ncbi:hypothetical protein D6C92_08843 [Aureobasidium pullulans]|nr:hypothetical protein D6C92_08843 [Aureobasidium pullulans]
MDEPQIRLSRLLFADGNPVTSPMIGSGIDGFIIRTGPRTVMKIPKLRAEILSDGSLKPEKENEWLIGSLEAEKAVYQRLEGVQGLANCLRVSSNGIELDHYQNGSLEDYMRVNDPPVWEQRLHWIMQLVDFVAACHEKRVLWFDIALRNLLLADDWTIRAIDFANSTALPLETDLATADWDGYTEKLEVLHVTNVIYSISQWEKFQVNCVYAHEWPLADSFPSTQHLDLGPIITKAWNHHYQTIAELRRAISSQ